MEEFEIYTDGGYSPNQEVGAWSFVVLKAGRVHLMGTGSSQFAESAAAEIFAVIQALTMLPDSAAVKIKADCQFVLQTIEMIISPRMDQRFYKSQIRKRLMNYIDVLIVLLRPHRVSTGWVKSRTSLNRICDELCRDQISSETQKCDVANPISDLVRIRRDYIGRRLSLQSPEKGQQISGRNRTSTEKLQDLYDAHKVFLPELQAILRRYKSPDYSVSHLGDYRNA